MTGKKTPAVVKREIYARFGVQLRNNRRAFKAERIAPGAMGLYAFMIMDARAELPEVDGFVPEEVVLSAWGRPAEERGAQAEALCSVDLIERVAGGYVVIKYAEHNDTRAIVENNRKSAAKRMRNVRANIDRTLTEQTANVQRTEGERSPDVPYSYSPSFSDSDLGSREGVQGETDPPEWFRAAADAAAMAIGGEVGELPARWVSYKASRGRKGWAKNHEDAVGWISDVVRSERRQAALQRRDRNDVTAERPKPSREQAKREAQEFAAQLRARFQKTGTGGEQ